MLLLSRGVFIPPSQIVPSTHLLKVSPVIPENTFDMTPLYKPINVIFLKLKSSMSSQVEKLKSSMSSQVETIFFYASHF